MDYSSLLSLLQTKESLSEIGKASGTTPDEVGRVLKAAIPLFMENGAKANEGKLTKAAESGTNRSMLGTLLGSGAAGAIAQSSGVSNKKTSSILSLLAPLLLSGMLGGGAAQNNNNGLLSLLSGMLGGGAAAQSQSAQPAGTSGALGLLSSLLGGTPQSSPQSQQTVDLLGGAQSQPSSTSSQGGLMNLLMGLISTDTSKD